MEITESAADFVRRCWREDGGYNPAPEANYPGCSDTALSDLAAVTYAIILARTFGWELPDPDRSVGFIQCRQQPDGSYAHRAGQMDAASELAILYNTTQATVALRALGAAPAIDPGAVMDRFFKADAFRSLPWYTTSFFPLFYTALEKPFPDEYRIALETWMLEAQTSDGYLGDHIASTFHMAHFFRLLRQPTPRADEMVRRTLRDQTAEGGWNIRAPDWDVHACFDAVFVIRQLGPRSAGVQTALSRAGSWARSCRNSDGGFGHYPGWHSDMDAVYFQLGSLVQARLITAVPMRPADANALGWGHLMDQESD